MRAARVLIAALAVVAVSATTALACSCLRFKSAREQFDKAELIFVGRAEGRELTGRDGGPPTAVTRFAVQKTLKGPRDRARRVAHSEETAGMCGIRFRRGEHIPLTNRRHGGRVGMGRGDGDLSPAGEAEGVQPARHLRRPSFPDSQGIEQDRDQTPPVPASNSVTRTERGLCSPVECRIRR